MANITLITSGMTPREGMNTMNSNTTSIDADLTVFDVDDSTSETYEAIGPNAPSSSVLVGTSATQTLQNKTITSDNSVTGLGVAGDNILNIGRKDLHSTLIKFDSPEDNDNNYSSCELSVDDTNNVSTSINNFSTFNSLLFLRLNHIWICHYVRSYKFTVKFNIIFCI